MTLLPSAREPFIWHAVPGGTPRGSPLADQLLRRWRARLAVDGIEGPLDDHVRLRPPRQPGSVHLPLVDLLLGPRVSHHYFDEQGQWLPGRDVVAVADAESADVLPRGTGLVYAAYRHDGGEDDMDTNFWSLPTGGDVPWLYSAAGLRYAEPYHLADALIVPERHPLVGDDARVDRLLADLRDITGAFRSEHLVEPDGPRERRTDG